MRIALTIAGSDSGAGAGIQADLKTFAAHGVYGISAITAVTAQSSLGVTRADPMQADLVTAQLEAVVSDFGAHAVKTGMLANAAIVEAVAAAVQALELPYLVVDPVIVSSSGDPLLDDEGVMALKKELVGLAHAVTPNIPEAEVLSGVSIRSQQDLREAARRLFALGPGHVVITGGHPPNISNTSSDRPSDRIVDVVYDGDVFTEYVTDRVAGRHTHGTGCTYAAAITAHLALGRSLHEAVPLAQVYVAGAIRHAPQLGAGSGPINHFWRLDIDKAGRL